MIELLPLAEKLDARFTGPREILNPLVHLACTNRDQFERVVGLIRDKREAVGLPPLYTERGYDKTAYMRDFMAQKRERERRAVDIENMIRSPNEQLRGKSRLEFMQRQSATWNAQREAMLEAYRQRVGGQGRKDDIKMLTDQFWSRVDADLDALEQLAKQERMGVKAGQPTKTRSA